MVAEKMATEEIQEEFAAGTLRWMAEVRHGNSGEDCAIRLRAFLKLPNGPWELVDHWIHNMEDAIKSLAEVSVWREAGMIAFLQKH